MKAAVAERAQVAAYPFDELRADPPADGRRNKVLWQAPNAAGRGIELVGTLVENSRDDTDPVRVDLTPTVGGEKGVYSSIVDVPKVGCWRFDMTWDGQQATIYLPFN